MAHLRPVRAKGWLIGLFILSVALPLATTALAQSVVSRGPLCSTDKDDWWEWNRLQVRRILEGDFGEDVITPVVDRFKACEWQLKASPRIEACLDPLRRFATARSWDFKLGHSMGLAVPDSEYFNNVPYAGFLELPKELQDQTFLSWVDDEADAASLEKALAYIERVNADASEPWSAFIYRSLHLPTADDAAALGRFFVHVPGEDFDRYLQFGLRSDPLSELPNAVSLVSVQKTDPESGKPLPAPLARATDLWRIREGGATTLSTRFDVKGIVQNCYECHKTPLLPITPDAFVFDERRFGKTLKSVNERMASYRGLRFFGLDPADYGPGIGPVDSPRRTREFMEACSAGSISDPGQLVRIENAMNCQGCHDGTYRGELNFPSALHPQPTSGKSLVWMYVVEHGTMPLGRVDLTREDRAVLAECLRLELYGDFGSMPGLLEEWLAAKACWGALP